MSIKQNTEKELIEGVLKHGPQILEFSIADPATVEAYLTRIFSEHLDYPYPKDTINTKNWFIPDDYYPNLVEYLYGCCETDEQRDRVSLELDLFIKNGMHDVLYVMKYIVDTLRANNVLWGVGRGSSVSSYVLYLIGIHKIDSIKYKLPIEEFFKEI